MAIMANNTRGMYDPYYQEYMLPDGRRVSEAEYHYYRDKERYYVAQQEREQWLRASMASPPPMLVDAAAFKAAQASPATDPLAFLKSNNTKLLLTGETA